MRASYAQPEIITKVAMSAQDPHFLFLVSNNSSLPIMERVKGLLIFSQETNVEQTSQPDNEKVDIEV